MRLSPGALWLRLRQTFGRRFAWYRDVVRPRILATPPIDDTTDQCCEIHVLTSQKDWLNLIWTLKSFYIASRRRYALCIHEDGSLSHDELSALRGHFPAARIVTRSEADSKVERALKGYPRSLQFRRSNLLAPKVFDFVTFLESDRMALFDSDLLFFSEPTAYLERVEDQTYRSNTFNGDVNHGYTVEPEEVRPYIGHDLVPRVNTGLGLVHRDSIRWDWTEEFLGLPGILSGNFWRIEQTLVALCSSRYGVELLPDEYTLSLEPGIRDRPFRHYVGRIRYLMYREGMAKLVTDGILGDG